jgi:hypothetical protein
MEKPEEIDKKRALTASSASHGTWLWRSGTHGREDVLGLQ